jgi:AcrR family transcriptional regulator
MVVVMGGKYDYFVSFANRIGRGAFGETMASRRKPQVSSRKDPQQARSNDLVSAVLDAAVQVLRKEGAQRFTTARVAERAGVSVGSIYQYFPNKAAILFRVQAEEWRRTSAMLGDILSDKSRDTQARLRDLVSAFIRSECEEAEVRLALADAAPLYRDAPEAGEVRAEGSRLFHAFIDEALPLTPPEQRAMVADLIERTLSGVGSSYSEDPRTDEEIEHSAALADMLCAYLVRLERPS